MSFLAKKRSRNAPFDACAAGRVFGAAVFFRKHMHFSAAAEIAHRREDTLASRDRAGNLVALDPQENCRSGMANGHPPQAAVRFMRRWGPPAGCRFVEHLNEDRPFSKRMLGSQGAQGGASTLGRAGRDGAMVEKRRGIVLLTRNRPRNINLEFFTPR
jgi:hypothetical protein